MAIFLMVKGVIGDRMQFCVSEATRDVASGFFRDDSLIAYDMTCDATAQLAGQKVTAEKGVKLLASTGGQFLIGSPDVNCVRLMNCFVLCGK